MKLLGMQLFQASYYLISAYINIKKDKAIPVTGCEALSCFGTSRPPHFLENRLTDGGEVVSLTRRPPFNPRKFRGTHFCLRLSRPQGHSAAGRIRSIMKLKY
jgi:hypothetical protein